MFGKIVHLVAQTAPGGTERQLFHIVRSLHERGWPQAVVSFSVGGAWREHWLNMGISFHEIPRSPNKPWRLWQLSRIFRRQRPAIIHIWSPHLSKYVRWSWGRRGAAIVFGLRENIVNNWITGAPTEQVSHQRGMETADYIIGNSHRAFENLESRGVRLPPHDVIGNIVIPSVQAKPGEPVAAPRIVTVGALRKLKAYDVLLRAAGILASQGKSFELFLIGDGPERPMLESLTSELKLDDRVRFFGQLNDVNEVLAGAHIMAHPSKSEGLSNTILEGMAAGLPVVGTVETASEIIENDRTGLLVPVGRADLLADALARLLEDPALRERLGKASLQHVRECYNEETITVQYERIYRSLLA